MCFSDVSLISHPVPIRPKGKQATHLFIIIITEVLTMTIMFWAVIVYLSSSISRFKHTGNDICNQLLAATNSLPFGELVLYQTIG